CAITCTALSLFIACGLSRRQLQSFPTRRSSDLSARASSRRRPPRRAPRPPLRRHRPPRAPPPGRRRRPRPNRRAQRWRSRRRGRSEEHTSELQSRENLVCRLLLEKKKAYVSQLL